MNTIADLTVRDYGGYQAVLATHGEPTPPVTHQPNDHLRHAGVWGWVTEAMSEQGDPRLQEVFAYIDKHMSPTWKDGGYYYPVNYDTWVDGKFVGVAPTSGNADFAYARLNVPGGLHSLYNSQWGDEHFSEPTLSDISRNVDVVRAKFVPEKNALVLGMRPPHGMTGGEAKLEFANIRRQGQKWTLQQDGVEIAHGNAERVSGGTKARLESGKLVLNVHVDRQTQLVMRWT